MGVVATIINKSTWFCFTTYFLLTFQIVASYHDNSPLSEERLRLSRMEVHTSIDMRGGGRRELNIVQLKMSETSAVWEYKIDLISELGIYLLYIKS